MKLPWSPRLSQWLWSPQHSPQDREFAFFLPDIESDVGRNLGQQAPPSQLKIKLSPKE